MYLIIGGVIILVLVAGTAAYVGIFDQNTKNTHHNEQMSNNDRRSVHASLIAQQIHQAATEAKIKLAQSYEHANKGQQTNPKEAFEVYFELAKSGVDEVFPPLERLGDELSAIEQKKLSELYQLFKNESKAKYWQDKANEINETMPSID